VATGGGRAGAGLAFRHLALAPAGSSPAGQQSQLLLPVPSAIEGASESDNWSGYVDAGPGAQFTAVSGDWTVPSITSVGATSSWVGIGGLTTPGLVQTGTEVTNTLGYDQYYAWYELLPQPPIVLGGVAPGDSIQARISQAGPATWRIAITDVTERTTWSGPVADVVNGTSAEWIEEAPRSVATGALLALPDFGRVTFSGLNTEGPGAVSATGQPFYMVSAHAVIAYPSRYDAGTDSFTDTYGSPKGGVIAFPPAAIAPTTVAAPTTVTAPTTTAGATTTTLAGSAPSTASTGSATTTGPAQAAAPAGGYWLAGADGGVFAFGGAHFYGAATMLGRDPGAITGIASTPDHRGYWLVSATGGVFAFGDAHYFGSIPMTRAERELRHFLPGPIVGITPTADGRGYYLVGNDGSVYTFGDARFLGSCGDVPGGCSALASSLVLDGSGAGYWLVLQDGTTQAFGTAPALRNVDCIDDVLVELTTAVAGAPNPGGGGYWTILADGTTCASGDAAGHGIWAGFETASKDPAVAIVPTGNGAGAWVVLSDGEVDPYGAALDLGDLIGKGVGDIVGAAGW
jgi:hypothetical protein